MPVIYTFKFFLCALLPLCIHMCLFCVCSCPQENVRSSAASVVPLLPRRATCCATSSSIQERNPSSVTCAATPVAGGMPSLAIYAPTRVSMQQTPTPKTPALMLIRGRLGLYKMHDKFCTAHSENSVLWKGKLTAYRYGVTFFFFLANALQKYVFMKFGCKQ